MNTAVLPMTEEERTLFINALRAHCECDIGLLGVVIRQCEMHHSPIADPRWLNRSVFAAACATGCRPRSGRNEPAS